MRPNLPEGNKPKAWLVIPRLKIQNANAISSPLTWGFPSMTAFLGLMWALERKTRPEIELSFHGVGVICHGFSPLAASGEYETHFSLARNPPDAHGMLDSIQVEGRADLEISLIFGLGWPDDGRGPQDLNLAANRIQKKLVDLRLAGGVIWPPEDEMAPYIELDRAQAKLNLFMPALIKKGRLMPGFALVARPDLLAGKMDELAGFGENASLIDAWLDFTRINWRAEKPDSRSPEIKWSPVRRPKGWIVPIPAGYAALTEVLDKTKNARDPSTPFRFVEALYSLGEWIGLHRVKNLNDLLWYGRYDSLRGLYLVQNDYIFSR